MSKLSWTPNLLVRNWRLKLLAVAAATLTFYAIRGVTRYEVDYYVPVVVQVAEAGIAVLDQDPMSVRVRFRGSQEDLLRLGQSEIKAVVRASASSADGSERVPLRPRDIEGAQGVGVVKLDASEVQLTFDREVEKKVQVAKPEMSGTPLLGKAEVDFEPSSVVLRGPRRIIKDVKIVKTEPIDVEGRGTSFTRRAKVVPPGDSGVLAIEPSEIKVRVNIVTETVSRPWTNLTVFAVLAHAADVEVAFDPSHVDVFLHGREEVLNGIPPSAVMAFVDCVGLDAPGNHRVLVSVHVPAGLDVNATVEPKSVIVTLTRDETLDGQAGVQTNVNATVKPPIVVPATPQPPKEDLSPQPPKEGLSAE